MTLSPMLVLGIELALNRYLAADPEIAARLSKIDGRLIVLQLTDLELVLLLRINQDRLQVIANHADVLAEPDTVISGTALAMAAMSVSTSSENTVSSGLFSGEIQIRGDIDTGQQFQDVLGDIQIDWAGLLQARSSGSMSDVAIQAAGDGLASVQRWMKNSGKTLQEDVVEYCQEEISVTPHPYEWQAFSESVNQIRNDVDRLDARLRRLQNQQETL